MKKNMNMDDDDMSNMMSAQNGKKNPTEESSEYEHEHEHEYQSTPGEAAPSPSPSSKQPPLEPSSKKSIVSILNLVVDHVMMPPCPLEPDEFRWKWQYDNADQKDSEADIESGADVGNLLDETLPKMDGEGGGGGTENGANANVKVPVIRIFGPIVRGEGMLMNHDDDGKGKDNDNDGVNTNVDEMTNSNANKTKSHTHTNPSGIQNNEQEQSPRIIHQSGCLHIHGAFPYMLVRPVQAGADASSSFYRAYNDAKNNRNGSVSGNGKSKNTCSTIAEEDEFQEDDDSCMNMNLDTWLDAKIDWDDVQSVQRITDDIHVRLESALRNHLEQGYGQGTSTSTSTSKIPTMPQVRFIRQITVVSGRGFYTFCNGGIAPFLRIEYYDPSHRWRVKIMLERGLDCPKGFLPGGELEGVHEHGGGNGTSHGREGLDVDVGMDVLKFRCYEAHIPYTMQFFKVSEVQIVMHQQTNQDYYFFELIG